MGLLDLLKPKKRGTVGGAAEALYAAAVAQARQPAFYTALGAPDTLDGRFDLLVLHVHLLCRRLSREGEAGSALAQALFDAMFKDMDRNLREMGVTDPGVPKRIKAMGQAFYGRVAAYENALAGSDSALAETVARNILGKGAAASAPSAEAQTLAAYVRACVAALEGVGRESLAAGRWSFPPIPVAR